MELKLVLRTLVALGMEITERGDTNVAYIQRAAYAKLIRRLLMEDAAQDTGLTPKQRSEMIELADAIQYERWNVARDIVQKFG